MKKTVKVNIGGFSYNIDEDAYNTLKIYLDDITARLGSGNDAKETIKDIEDRISELFAEKVGANEVVSIQIVENVINQLGNPEEISGNNEYTPKNRERRPLRRLYRNSEGSIFGGVCSGLAEYFAVDPIVIRLLMVGLLFLKGFGLVLYLVLWIATPMARTPKQKLEMKGEPVTFSNIEKNLREEIKTTSDNLKNSEPRSFIEKLMSFIGQVAYWILKTLLILFKVIAIATGIAIAATMLFVFLVLIGVLFFSSYMVNWFVPEIGGFSLSEFVTSMFDISSSIWVTVPTFLIIAIPVVALIYAGIRIIFRFKARDGLIGIIAAVIWVAAVVMLALTVFFQFKSLTIRESVVNNIAVSTSNKENSFALKSFNFDRDSIVKNSDSHYVFFDFTISSINGKKLISAKPELIIEKSNDESPNITIVKKARGANKILAKQNASDIIYNYTIQDTAITLDPIFTLPENTKWKNQDIVIVLNLPEGTSVYLDSTILDLLDYNQPYCNYWPDEMVGKTWTMTKNGLREKR